MKTYKSLQSFLALSLLVCCTVKPVIGDLVDSTLNTANDITNNAVNNATEITEDVVNVPGEIIGKTYEFDERDPIFDEEIIGNADEISEEEYVTPAASALAAQSTTARAGKASSQQPSGKAEYALVEEEYDLDDADGFDADDFDDFDDEDEDYIFEYDDEEDDDLY